MRAELRDFSQQVQLTYVDEETLPRLLEAIKAVPPRSLILYIWQRGFQRKDTPDPADVARLVAAAAPVPVYGTVDLNIGTGIVGGVVRGTRETGVRVGEMALQILERHTSAGHSDRGRAARADLRLAPAAAMGHRSVAPAAADRTSDSSRRRCGKPIVRTSSRSPSSSPRSCCSSPDCSCSAPGGAAPKRRFVAREATIRAELRTDSAARRTADQRPGGRAREHRPRSPRRRVPGPGRRVDGRRQPQELVRLDSGRARAAGVVEDPRRDAGHVRRDSASLARSAPGNLATGRPGRGIARALRRSREAACRAGAIHGRTATSPASHPDVALCFFRIAQESLRNGVVHGEARRLSVSLARSGDDIELTVTDDGRGFDLEAVRGDGGGLGLVSIEERAHVIGGDVQIVTGPGQGTTIHVRAPAGAAVSVQ